MRDFYHNIGVVNAINPETVTTAAVSGPILDTLGFNAVAFAVSAGAITDGTYAVTIAEADDNAMADGAPVASSNILGTLPSFGTANANATERFGYIGSKRYLQLTLTPTGATHGGLFAAVAIKGWPNSAPVV